jgi:delta 1-pyrroline-5-carboxylate dehydrogenase
VPRGGGADVERAVAAARAAFPAWSRTPIADRAAALRALADGLEARGEPRRVVLEVVPEGRIGFDSTQMWRDTPDAVRRD